MADTQLTIINGSGFDVTVWITLGSYPSGAVASVQDLPFVTNFVPNNPLQGSFVLEPGPDNAMSYTSSGEAFVGNICFGTPPINCPTAGFPSGVNLAEFALNCNYLPTPGDEAVDISCVAGVNALILFELSGGDDWTTGPSDAPITVTQFSNGLPGQNTGRVGVYPICCDVCTGSLNPPVCPASPPPPACETPQAQPICNVQRASGSGGTVTIWYDGPTTI